MPDQTMSAMTANSSTGPADNIDLSESLSEFSGASKEHNSKQSSNKPGNADIMKTIEENPEILAL